MSKMSEDDRVKQWQSEAVEMNFKTWLMLKLDTAEARAAELAAQVEQLTREVAYLRSTDHAADVAFERMAPVDWRGHNTNVGIRHTEYEGEAETPFGIALDGGGDEVQE